MIIRIYILSCHLWHFFFFLILGQNLQDDLEKQEKNLQRFGSVTNQLLKECHPPVTETLTNTLKDVTMRYGTCSFCTVMHYLYHSLMTNNDRIKTCQHFEFELSTFYSTHVSMFTNELKVTKCSEDT